MLSLILGITGFVLYILYDINSFTFQSKILHTAFALGTALIAAATILDIAAAWKIGAFFGLVDAGLTAAAAVCFAALVYSLFFALPFQETYAEQGKGRHTCDRGVYALCRHPGILCFFGVFLFLGAAALPGKLLVHGMVLSLLNLVYAYFQDRITFPKTFCDYEAYREKVPFLIPTRNSIRLARQTWNRSVSEEDKT